MKKNGIYNLVNWIDGMDMSSKHFQQTENFFVDSLCDAAAIKLTNYDYGLLPETNIQTEDNNIEIKELADNKVEITLRRCNAITPGGCRIIYNPNPSESLRFKHSFGETTTTKEDETRHWDVVLSVDPFNRIATGIPDQDEMPPRHPDAVPKLNIHLLPQGQIDASQLNLHHLVIGRVSKNGTKYEVNTQYIPPCARIASHPELINYYRKFGKLQGNIYRCSKIILAKILSRPKNEPLALCIKALCENIQWFHSQVYFSYQNKGLYYSPIDLIDCFARFAHLCMVSINFETVSEKEILLKYFYEWGSLTPATFEGLLTDTMHIEYDHNNMRVPMLQVQSLLESFSQLWERLSTLEYIGQHKDNIIISERSAVKEVPKEKGSWTILD